MTRRIPALEQLHQVMNRAVAILCPPPDWLQDSWKSAKRQGLDKLTMKEIDAEIAASRRRDRQAKLAPTR